MSQSTPTSVPAPTLGSATEANRALAIRWFEEVWNERRDETVHEIMHPESVGHMEGGEAHGPSDFLAARASLLDAFPDLRVSVDDTAADGEHVVVRWSARATHSGPGLGVAATSRSVAFRGMTWLTFRDHKIVEGWDAWNLGGLLESLETP